MDIADFTQLLDGNSVGLVDRRSVLSRTLRHGSQLRVR